MKLGRRIEPRYLFIGLYVFAFLVYIIYGLTPVKAADYEISTDLNIPSINLNSSVTTLRLENNKLNTPDTIVGRFQNHKNKTLLIGHSTTIFTDLNQIELGAEIFYDETNYKVTKIETLEKSDIRMEEILAESNQETIVLMTCAGELLEHGDATHRLIIEAVKD
ncbi:sortase [Candidatus Saccharibacteria bacterium]|nr:sortase [Candidatus Saccharibacteria bacterium]